MYKNNRKTNLETYFEIVRFLRRRKCVKDVSEKFGVTEKGAHQILNRLVDIGAIRVFPKYLVKAVGRGRPRKYFVSNYVFIDCVNSNNSEFRRLLEEIRIRPMTTAEMRRFLNFEFKHSEIKGFVNDMILNGIIEFRFPKRNELKCRTNLFKQRKYAFFIGGNAYKEYMGR